MQELAKLKADLETKDAYNRIFIEQAPTAIAMLDNNMNYLAVSQRWISDFKMEDKEIIGRSHYDLFPEIGDAWKANHQKCLQGATDTCDEAPFVRADGSVQWIYWDVRPWYIAKDTIGGLIMHTGDITHLKDKEEERVRIEKILDKTNEVARIGTWDIDLLKNEVFWSKMVCEIHEVSHDYTPNLETAINFIKKGESRDTIEKVVQEAIMNGTPYDVEVELVTAKNTIIWARAMGQAEIVDGQCIRLYGVFQDINERKLSQLALNKAHTELKAIFNSRAVAIVTTDTDGIIRQFNHGAEILTGYTASEMIGLQRPKKFHLREELDRFILDVAKKYDKNPKGFSPQLEMSKHNAYDTREWNYLRKDGSTLPALLTLTSMKDEEGNLIGYLGVSTDISEKRIAQNELVRKNQLLNFAEEITLMGNWQWDTVADKVEWSDNLFNIFKLDRDIERIRFDTYFNFVHPDDKGIVSEYFDKTKEEKRLNKFTHRIIAGDGQLKYIQLLGEVITNDEGAVIEMIGTCQDITTIKEAEKKLHEAHLQLQAIFNSGPIAIVSTDLDGVINHFNHGAEVLTGYSASEMIGLQKPFIYHTEEELTQFTKDIAKRYNKNPEGFHPQLELTKQNEYDTREWTYIRKDGSTLPVQLTLTGVKDEGGKNIGFLGVSTDVSERRKAEDELLRKNYLLNFAEKITMMGNWQWNTQTNNVKWSANLYTIFGVKKGTAITYDTYFSFVHPEDKEKVTNYVQNAIAAKKKNLDLLHRIQLKDGTIKTIQLLAEIITNSLDDITEFVGTCQDVTEQKMAENKFRGLLESAPDAMVIVNEKGKIQLINKQTEKLFGYNANELFGKSVEILMPHRLTSTHTTLRENFFANPKTRGTIPGAELFGIHKNGQEIPIQISLSPFQTEEGLLVSAAIRDVTEQKITQAKIINAKNELESLAQKLTIQNDQLADFAHITSHNLRAPVSNLNSLLDFYNNSESEDEKIILFEKFEKVIHHLTGTLNTLVESLRAKNVSLEDMEDVSFEEVLHKTKEILGGQIMNTAAVITSDFSKIGKINYNKIYLESIFLNLLSNSIKYKSEARVPVIHIESEINNGKITLKFKDNGLGIDLKMHGHKLFGLNKTFHRHKDAKGVGLFITKTQIEAMGGTIRAASKVNEGTTFYLNFN
ncbi:PAS domain S-box protein [Cellulophaga sp. F20128]|uniref:PAS domain-containing sensor histidine kinase n=1 Tax=Cellulophaga sp. F20128 TaxID=2926413 RepID=UPI001FF6215A|nr:PAS domain S-box protein [Cellulophaga sp. F20128]MCK0157272.1 PAS domain S-box protein [Cellulophaga sp. F20128]